MLESLIRVMGFVFVAMLFSPRIGAKCAEPRPSVSIASGSTVPARFVFHLFLPLGEYYDSVCKWDRHPRHQETMSKGLCRPDGTLSTRREDALKRAQDLRVMNESREALEVQLDVETTEADMAVVRVSVDATGLSEVRAEFGPRLELATWKIGKLRRRASHRVVGNKTSSSQWMCSHELAQVIEVKPVLPAVLVEVLPEGAPQSEARRFMLPADHALWSPRPEDEPPLEHAEFGLGYLNCVGNTYRWERPVSVRLFTVEPDGAETLLTPEPLRLVPPKAEAPFAE